MPIVQPFERLKRAVYLRNPPQSVGDEVPGLRLVESTPYETTVQRLEFLSVERGFYEESNRKVKASSNPFAPTI